MKRLLSLALLSITSLALHGEDFHVIGIDVDDSGVRLKYPAEEGFYYILYRGDRVESIATAIDVADNPTTALSDGEASDRKEAYYRVEKIAESDSRDTDGDGLSDIAELKHRGILDPLDASDADLDFDNDGKTNKQELTALFGASDPGDAVFENITFKTADNFTIAASLGLPRSANETPKPVVIFIHQGGSNRSEWEAEAKRAFREDWVTLAYDIRGHGDSSGTWTNAWFDDPNNAPEDLKAAIEYVKALTNTDNARIAVVGASVGGNLACVASARYGVKTAVAISHKTSAITNLAGVSSLSFRSIYHLSSQSDQGGQRAKWASDLFEQTAEPRKLEIVNGSGHGVSVFKTDATVPDRILQWLRDTL